VLLACNENPTSPSFNNTTDIFFNISKINSENDFSSAVSTFSFKKSNYYWYLNSNGSIDISKENIFEITLDNGDILDFGIWFLKRNEDTTKIDFSIDKNWRYKSAKLEKERFFSDFDEACILIGNKVIFYSTQNYSFEILNVRSVSDEYPKNYISLIFEGKATGFYDPEGKYSAVYFIEKGIFRGILK
jgi:hypothetical protein